MCARITWPLSSSTEKVVLGNTCLMLPKTSSGASRVSCTDCALDTRGLESLLRAMMTSFALAAPAALEGSAARLRRFFQRFAHGGIAERVLHAVEPLTDRTFYVTE